MSRFLYLVRHGEHEGAEFGVDDGPLSDRGRQQADRIAQRLRNVPLTHLWHSPLQRTEETAQRIMAGLGRDDSVASSLLMDCIPDGPEPDMPKGFESFYGGFTPEQWEAGSAQMADAFAEWMTPSGEDRHELLVTHNFVIAWFTRHVLDAPAWRWLTISQVNCGLTVIRIRTIRPHVLIAHNDSGHLPPELLTGFPTLSNLAAAPHR